jgi:DNA-binding winged helix-turn-helix (wHTH) protein
MRWQIAGFVFCDQQQTLTSEQNIQQLEPMVVELLSYFCQNIDQIISKDQLIEQVWLGRIVSDNAVSKLVTKLRKAFNDDARQPKFIATFPKKGYKFIALATQINEAVISKPIETLNASDNIETEYSNTSLDHLVHKSANESTSPLQSSPDIFIGKRALAFLFIVIISAIYIFQIDRNDPLPVLTHAKALTVAAGNELFPSVSPDGTRVSYMSALNDRMHLMVKNIKNERIIEINHEEGVGVGPASWSFDGNLLAYLVATPERCQYYIRHIDGLKLGEAKLIHNCPAGSYGSIAFTHDNNRLIFTESEGGNSPYVLFEINLITEKKRRLTQPEIFLGGNSQFDMHPSENKLLISSPDKQQWEGFYSLDLEKDELKLLFKQDAYICCGIWSHDGKRVVLMGEHPAYQLISYDLVGQDMKIIYSGSRQILRPVRHTNGKDYLFISGQQNTNVYLLDLATKQQSTIAEASVTDRLATFAHNKAGSQKVAYISLATGTEEVWITDTANSQRVKLTDFNDSRHYVDLKWSPNDQLLMALTLNEIHLIDTSSGSFERLKLPQTEIRAVSFKDNETLAYSLKKQGQWQVNLYQLNLHHVLPAEPKWQYIQFTQDIENTLWLDQNNNLYWGAQQRLVTTAQLLAPDFLSGRAFNLKKRAHDWFWSDNKDSYSLMRYSEKSEALESLLPSNVYHYDVHENKVIFGQTLSANTDIYQTQSRAVN